MVFDPSIAAALKSSSRHDDELSFFVLVALYDLIPRNRLAISLTNALVFDGREIFLMQQAEADVIGANCGPQLHRDVDESKCE